MRCSCCDRILSSLESVLKNKTTGEYLDICKKCLKDIPEIQVVYPKQLIEEEDYGTEDSNNDTLEFCDWSIYDAFSDDQQD